MGLSVMVNTTTTTLTPVITGKSNKKLLDLLDYLQEITRWESGSFKD